MIAEDLIAALLRLPRDATVVMSSDEEGNDFHELSEVELNTDLFEDYKVIILWPGGRSLDL